MGGLERGGTSRKAKILNNIFCDCREAAIVFPTEDNEADGNLYLGLQGGYLRIMYPAPEICLDLAAWQEFTGFDQNGQSAWFGFSLNPDDMTLSVVDRTDSPLPAPGPARPAAVMRDPGAVRKVKVPVTVNCDFNGKKRGKSALPGPFASWEGSIPCFWTSLG